MDELLELQVAATRWEGERVVAFVASSCEQGICGTCETRVLGGVPEHHDQLLTDAERAAGETMLICVGRCAAGPLVLDL